MGNMQDGNLIGNKKEKPSGISMDLICQSSRQSGKSITVSIHGPDGFGKYEIQAVDIIQ